jgi:TIR domain
MADSPQETVQQRAYRLLKAIKAETENAVEPVFDIDLARALNMTEGEARSAFRYLAGKGWIETYNLDGAARINAAGHDVVAAVERQMAAHNQRSKPDPARAVERTEQDSAVEWDVFISHASEDKDDFVRPLAERLRHEGLRVWYDDFTLTVGDSLRRSIDRGLARSRYGVVVVSQNFLKKEWPQKELDGLVAREVGGVKVILPVWHNISADQIRAYSPILADRLAVSSAKGLDHVTDQLLQAIGRKASPGGASESRASAPPRIPTQDPNAAARLRQLSGYASELHSRRVAEILAAKAPVALQDGARIVMHVVPLSAVGDRPTESFEEIARNPNSFPPIRDRHARDSKITYDGLTTGSNSEGLSRPQRAYVTVFRSGTVEAVESSIARGREHNFVELPHLEAIVVKYACLYAKSLNGFGVAPPLAVCVSLVNVKGMKLTQDLISTAFVPEDLPCSDLDQQHLNFGQAIFDAVPPDYNPAARYLRPVLTHLANAAGLHASPNFDAGGNYTPAGKL